MKPKPALKPKPKASRSSAPILRQLKSGLRAHAAWLATLTIWLGICTLAVGIYTFNWFTLKQYTCQFDEKPCPPVVNAQLNRLLGKNLLFIDYSSIETQIAANLSRVATVELTPSPPHLLLIKLIPHTPIATVQTLNHSYRVAITGHVFSDQISGNELPTISVNKLTSIRLEKDQITEPSVLQSLKLISLLASVGLPHQALTIEDTTSATLKLKNQQTAVFSLEKPLNPQVSSLQLILQKSTMPEAKPFIDLRFEKPVLRLSLTLEPVEATASYTKEASAPARDIVRP